MDNPIVSDPIKHGWFSVKANAACGCVEYTTPSGAKVLVTMVTEKRAYDPIVKWDDLEYVGEVVHFCGRR